MYEILRKSDASSEEMAEAYVAIEENVKSLETERESVHAEIIQCKLETNGKQDLIALMKERYTDLGLDIEAGQAALRTLFDRMAETIPKELEQRRADAQTKIRELQNEAAAQFNDALEKLAEYYALMENSIGTHYSVTDWIYLQNQLGRRWNNNTRIQLGQLIAKKKAGLPEVPSINRQIRDAQDETRKIGDTLAPWNPQKVVHAVLDQFRRRD